MGDNKILSVLNQNSEVSKGQIKEKVSKEVNNEFKNLLKEEVAQDFIISKHAMKRMEQRELAMDSGEFVKIKEAIQKLSSKGGKDSLVITSNGAYIVDVENRKLVTAMNKNDLKENVFTKIDSTIFIN
jgi:flagellar operon protein